LFDRNGRTRVTLSYLAEPWGMTFATPAAATVHVVVRGRARCAGTLLEAGDVALVTGPHDLTDPAGTAPGVVVDGPGRTREPGEPPDRAGDRWRLAQTRSYGDDLDAATLVVHAIHPADDVLGRRVLAGLPAVLHVRAADVPAPLRDLLAVEAVRDAPGQQAVLDRVVDLLVLTALRTRGDVRFLAARADPVVGPALEALHADPAHPWTVAALAARAGVSRASLARRFAELVGVPPVRYLTGYRLDLAADLVQGTDRTLTAIAREVGYADAFVLSAAYRRRFGRAPSADRGSSTAR
jgi:AraC-like DNA-binding protein